jgi:hypothetical protein
MLTWAMLKPLDDIGVENYRPAWRSRGPLSSVV